MLEANGVDYNKRRLKESFALRFHSSNLVAFDGLSSFSHIAGVC
jgi:hypothetical protein